jgi:hypothetical protein
MILETRNCTVCGMTGTVEVDDAEAAALREGINTARHSPFSRVKTVWADMQLIQNAMPTTPAPIREQIITGIHPECWENPKKEWEEEGDQ